MGFLKNVFTRTHGATYAGAPLIPSSEPSTDDYVLWKAKHYGSKLGSENTRANAIDQYDKGAMQRYFRLLKKAAKIPLS
jgi:hypothetical protein